MLIVDCCYHIDEACQVIRETGFQNPVLALLGFARQRDRETLAAATIALLSALALLWLVQTFLIDRPVPTRFGTDRPSEILGEVYCRPNCQSAFKRCGVSVDGFPYQKSRCQESLKQCLIGCRGDAD